MVRSGRWLGAGLVLSIAAFWGGPVLGQAAARAPGPQKSKLPLPSSLPREEYESHLHRFLDGRQYDEQAGHLGWRRDKGVRDTGPFVGGVSYGTHPAVRIYYSPEIIDWLVGGRKGAIPDGSVIIKEQFEAPAARWKGKSDDELKKALTSWTVMVKDSAGSKDGWFWAEYSPGSDEGPERVQRAHAFPFAYPRSGFGTYCIRCHASAEAESTFVSLKNVEGFPGEPLTFRVDDSWKTAKAEGSKGAGETTATQAAKETGSVPHDLAGRATRLERAARPAPLQADPEFLRFFDAMRPTRYFEMARLPNETYDMVMSGPKRPQHFVTSSQCMSCHSGAVGPFQAMFLPREKTRQEGEPEAGAKPGAGPDGVNVSPYGEWRWSMMGLSGRDPVFHAQLETELALYPKRKAEIQDTCFRCHGAMGQRQYHLDHGESARFALASLFVTDPKHPNFQYGALARDGVSCTVCHRIIDAKEPLERIITGRFAIGKADELFGPYKDDEISPHAMKNAVDVTPKFSSYLSSSRLCASCHVVRLPIYDKKGDQVGANFEQATYLEWLNSDYEDEYHPRSPRTRSCQECHMPGHFRNERIRQPMAIIEDHTYPAAEHRLPDEKIKVRLRDKFSRHELLGINIFVLEMFNQFDEILGVRKTDFMTGSTQGLPHAIENALYQARNATAELAITSLRVERGKLNARVKITNLAGHRFPSGVGFRRAFLEFQVIDTSEGRDRLFWASGRTNDLGVIIDADGKPLASEFFSPGPNGRPSYEPHHERITRQDQAQIYQELVQNPAHEFTTSFLAQGHPIKDNRLLPRGWSEQGPPGYSLPADYLAATFPFGIAEDPDYRDGQGSDTLVYDVPLPESLDPKELKVAVSLFYQSIPPFYLKMRFNDAQGEATRRLHGLASHLKLGNDLEGWKLRLSSVEAKVGDLLPASSRPPAPGEPKRTDGPVARGSETGDAGGRITARAVP